MEKLAKFAKALAALMFLEVSDVCNISELIGVPADDIRKEAEDRFVGHVKSINDLVAEELSRQIEENVNG